MQAMHIFDILNQDEGKVSMKLALTNRPSEYPTMEIRHLSMTQYASDLSKAGTKVLAGTNNHFWFRSEYLGMVRMHGLDQTPPTPGEVRKVLVKGPAAVASYVMAPDEKHPANAWLYLCTDRSYGLDKLPHAMRKNVRRGLKEFNIEPISADQFLRHGARPFCDSRLRAGLSDGTVEEFRYRFQRRARQPGRVILGAWKDDILAGFLFITLLEGWAINEGPFGGNAFLHLRPNDALIFWELSHYLAEGMCLGVSAGLSSIQVDAAEKGLHVFKTKAGFVAQPVHRAFVLHPLLVPFLNRATLKALKVLLHFKPDNRLLRKADGVLTALLGQ
jgi:hypothetical protein